MENNSNIQIVGTSNLKQNEIPVIGKYAENALSKISKISRYDNLKILIKRIHGAKHTKHSKYRVDFMLSHGRKVLTMNRMVSVGTSDEVFNDKVRSDWNVVNIVHDALHSLEQMVKNERKKQIGMWQ